ncbi:MAG: site-specific integrase [Muribaculaceae bacterium]|nr:site-specific integrase [Muribaculaceae bacterium]
MVSIKIKFRPSTVSGHEGTIYYQLIHERRVRQVFSGLHIYADEWNAKNSTVVCKPESGRTEVLISVRRQIGNDIERFIRLERSLRTKYGDCTLDMLISEYRKYVQENSLFRFMELLIGQLKAKGRMRTSETYTSALKSFRKFMSSPEGKPAWNHSKELPLDTIGPEIIEAYETWLRARGLAPNTISFYMRILRATYNRAVEQDITDNRHPFRHVYTGIDKTRKRAISISNIKRIKDLDLSEYPCRDFARDMFLMSFYLRGMSLIDMAYLRKTDLQNGYVCYRRRKTGQRLVIKWTREMQSIIDKYAERTDKYLLPIIRRATTNERSSYRNTAYSINRNLRKIAEQAGISGPLTLYVARHSWASAAKTKGIPVSVISEGMGHDSETTTQIYLASLDTRAVDNANAKILRCLK